MTNQEIKNQIAKLETGNAALANVMRQAAKAGDANTFAALSKLWYGNILEVDRLKKEWIAADCPGGSRRAIECSECCAWFYEINTTEGKCAPCNDNNR